MKKRILLVTLLVALFVCVFAISVSASGQSYTTFDVTLADGSQQTVYTVGTDRYQGRIYLTTTLYTEAPLDSEGTYGTLDWSNVKVLDFSNSMIYFYESGKHTEMSYGSNNGGMMYIMRNGATAATMLSVEKVITGKATHICGNSFNGLTNLKQVDISSSLTNIEYNTFDGCTSLTDVNFAENGNLTTLGNQVFIRCSGLETITLPNTITSMGTNMFSNCTSLETVGWPTSITVIPSNTFSSCTSLTSFEIPSNITAINSSAFLSAGITSLHIPASVTYLGYQVAEGSAIQSLTFAAGSQLKHIDHRAFMSCKSLEGVVIIPEGVENIEYGLFSSCTKLKAVKLPSTFTTSSDYGAMFGSCSALEFVQLSGGMDTIPGSMFENCTSLKAISIPEGVTTIKDKALRNCTSLQAIYLPSTLTTLGITSTGTDKGVFYQSKNIYFVQEPFEVFNGDTLIGDSFVMPTKPDVYYMPSLLNFVGNSEFQNCNKINKVVVFPTGVTSVAGCSQGAFQGVGSSTSPVTIVFLGDITAIQIKQNDATYSNISFVFANSADKDLNDVAFAIGSSGTNKKQTNTYMYFCAGNVVYDLSSFAAPNSTAYTVQETDFTKSEGTTHFSDPRKAVVTPADCLNARAEDQTCFCGFDMPSVTIGSALGHEHDLTKGATITDILFENGYTANGCKEIKCARCDEKDYNSVVEALFNNVRYSVAEKGFGICVNYNVNKDALAVCKDAGKAVSFGVVAIMADKVENNGPLANDGTVSTQKNVIAADVTADNLCAVTLKIVGDESAWKANAEKAIYVLGYATNGTDLEYLGSVSEIAADRNNIASVKSLVIGQFFDFNV